MVRRQLHTLLWSALAALGGSLAATPAGAQTAIHGTSDAIYVGFRGEPGAAFLVAYDLDILVSDVDAGITLGPSVSFSFGGSSSADLGRRQEWLLASDFLRARLTVYRNAYGLRVMALIGAGMWFAALYDQASDPHEALLDDGSVVVTRQVYPWELLFGALLTGGVSADWYFTNDLGIGVYLVGHARLDDRARMPGIWIEAGLGGRWGQ